MRKALLYNLSGTEQGRKLKLILIKLGCGIREVKPEEYGEPVGYLAGIDGYKATGHTDPDVFKDEMLVLSEFPEAVFSLLLTSLRNAKIHIPLKAIVTEHNAAWDSAKLHRELLAEFDYMKNNGGKKKLHTENK